MADLAPEEHRWGSGQEMPFPAGRQHRKQEDTTIKHKAQRAAALHLTQITRCSSGQFSGDGGIRSYPLFSLEQSQDFFPAVTRQKHFAPGDFLTVYKSPKGRFSLEPEPVDYLLFPLQLLPVFFVGLFVLCLLVTGAFLLWTGVAGLLSPVLR